MSEGRQDVGGKASSARDAAKASVQSAARRSAGAGRGKRELHPLGAVSQAVVRFGRRHTVLAALGACLAVVAMVVLLVWYEVFSGAAEPPQFVYASF